MKTLNLIYKAFAVMAIVLALNIAEKLEPSGTELFTAIVLVGLAITSLLKHIDKHFKY